MYIIKFKRLPNAEGFYETQVFTRPFVQEYNDFLGDGVTVPDFFDEEAMAEYTKPVVFKTKEDAQATIDWFTKGDWVKDYGFTVIDGVTHTLHNRVREHYCNPKMFSIHPDIEIL